jgi:hypothetical protein
MKREPVCDFCSEPGPGWTCPARDFDTGVPDVATGLPNASAGGWAACETCADLVRRGRRGELAGRSLRRTLARLREQGVKVTHRERPTLAKAVRDLQDTFWAHREGEPHRVTVVELAAFEKTPPEFVGPADHLRRRKPPEWLEELARGARHG